MAQPQTAQTVRIGNQRHGDRRTPGIFLDLLLGAAYRIGYKPIDGRILGCVEGIDRTLRVAEHRRPHSIRFSIGANRSTHIGSVNGWAAGHRSYLSTCSDSISVLLP